MTLDQIEEYLVCLPGVNEFLLQHTRGVSPSRVKRSGEQVTNEDVRYSHWRLWVVSTKGKAADRSDADLYTTVRMALTEVGLAVPPAILEILAARKKKGA